MHELPPPQLGNRPDPRIYGQKGRPPHAPVPYHSAATRCHMTFVRQKSHALVTVTLRTENRLPRIAQNKKPETLGQRRRLAPKPPLTDQNDKNSRMTGSNRLSTESRKNAPPPTLPRCRRATRGSRPPPLPAPRHDKERPQGGALCNLLCQYCID